VYNCRPPDLSGPPIQIYHPAFATFIRESLDTTTELTPETLDMARELICASLEFYEDESQRKAALEKLTFWKSILSTDHNLDSSSICADGSTSACSRGSRRIPVQIVELKNEIGEGGSDPIVQAERSHAAIFCSTRVGLSFSFPNSIFY
jgi:hypothetical protein